MNDYVPCPKCGGFDIKKVDFTLWGGVLGPRLFNHVNVTPVAHYLLTQISTDCKVIGGLSELK